MSWSIAWRAVGLAGLLLASAGLVEVAASPRAAPAPPNPDLVQRGALLFIDPRLSPGDDRSCATCHPGGGSDGKVYRAGETVAPRTPGARLTPSLRGVGNSPPYFWDGGAKRLRVAVERMLRVEMGGAIPPAYDLAALEAYVLSLPPFDRGRVLPDGSPTEPVRLNARRGFGVFRVAGCADCHPPPAYLDRLSHDVGTGDSFDTPTLLGVGERALLGHDGRWSTLAEALDAMVRFGGVSLSPDQRRQLLDYLGLL